MRRLDNIREYGDVSAEEGWIVAIDFGTAFSKAAAVPRHLSGLDAVRKTRPLRLGQVARANQAHFVPSAIFLMDGQIYFGPDAIDFAQRTNVGKREALQSFKMLLGTNDLEKFLPTKPSRKIDPDGVFNFGELIVLYLAYFFGLVEQAFREDVVIDGGSTEVWRYTRPGWFSERTQRDHAMTVALFRRADAVKAALPAKFWLRPLDYDAAQRALQAPMTGNAIQVEAGVFEASAAAAAYLPDVNNQSWCMIVIDMGAGTTDFGAYMSLNEKGAKPRLFSLDHTLTVAGDDIDRSLLNVIIKNARGIKSKRELGGLWRHLMPSIRARKEEIFSRGELKIDFYGHTIDCSIKQLQKSQDYRSIVSTINKDFRTVLERTSRQAARYNVKETVLVATGGGAKLPFIAEMVGKVGSKRHGMRISVAPTSPVWIQMADFREEVSPVFNQLAIAIGGALAPPELLIRTDDSSTRRNTGGERF